MKDDVIEKLNQEGNDGPGHGFYDDVDFEEVEECNNIIEKGGLNENGKRN